MRLLFTFVGDAAKAVLYHPVAPGSRADEKWRTRTEAAGETAFDRVVLLDGVEMRKRRAGDGTTVEIAVPLRAIGLRARPGALHRMDWGVLTSPDGRQVKQRAYWADVTATGTSDEAMEARLEPRLWGHIRFDSRLGLQEGAGTAFNRDAQDSQDGSRRSDPVHPVYPCCFRRRRTHAPGRAPGDRREGTPCMSTSIGPAHAVWYLTGAALTRIRLGGGWLVRWSPRACHPPGGCHVARHGWPS